MSTTSTLRILLVSHEATRTGAPRIAVEVAEALEQRGHHVITVLRWPGPLEKDLARASSECRREPLRRVRALARRHFPHLPWVSRFEELIARVVIKRYRPDVVYANTVKSASYVVAARRVGTPVALHVHELEPMASEVSARYSLVPMPEEVCVVACSQAVKQNLEGRGIASSDQIDVVESLVDAPRVRSLAHEAIMERGAPCDDDRGGLVVAACARADERKGVDLWLEAAASIRRRRSDLRVTFVWIGAAPGSVEQLAQGLGVADVVDFRGEVENPYKELARADVFTLASREDPFPLVVLEAMTLGRPVVAFDVGGVRDQLGNAGVLVPPGDVEAFADAVIELLDSPSERARLRDAALERVATRYAIENFRASVVEVVEHLARRSNDRAGPERAFPSLGASPELRLFLLKAFDAGAETTSGGPWRLPYEVDSITASGFRLEMSDAVHRAPWTTGLRRSVVRGLERRSVAFLQTTLARRRIAGSDVVVAMFESQGNALALLRGLGARALRRPRMAMIVCWLAGDIARMGGARLAVLRFAYRWVDRVFFFSSNQAEIIEEALGLAPERLTFVPFGIDHHYFTPESESLDGGYLLAVGRDRGRDWSTLFEAVRDIGIALRVACRDEDIAGLDIPDNVELLGFVSREEYRSLLAGAVAVAVVTHERAYPTGQTVALEAMAMAKCCVITDTRPMRDYLEDDVNAILVREGDVEQLRHTLSQVCAEPALRARIGRAGRQSVERQFNAERMWARIAQQLRVDCLGTGAGSDDARQP